MKVKKLKILYMPESNKTEKYDFEVCTMFSFLSVSL